MPNAAPLAGSRPRISVFFRDLTNVAVDPTTLNFRVTNPEKTEVVYVYGVGTEVVRDSAGHYHVDLPVTLPQGWGNGNYQCRFEAFDAHGDALAAAEVVLEVNTRYPTRWS